LIPSVRARREGAPFHVPVYTWIRLVGRFVCVGVLDERERDEVGDVQVGFFHQFAGDRVVEAFAGSGMASGQ
jgi:hypothetical protein